MPYGLMLVVASVLMASSAAARAVPAVLYFNGTASYVAATGQMTVDAVLTLTEEAGAVAVPGAVTFTAQWLATATPVPGVTVGTFAGPATPGDLLVLDAGAQTLLAGELLGLTMSGFDGFDFAVLEGLFSTTGGTLAALFGGGSDLLALQFNLDGVISAGMFEHDFSCLVDGRLSAVEIVEPGPRALLATALLLAMLATFGAAARARSGRTF